MQRVLIFGTGNLYREKEDYVRKNFDIVGFLDNKIKDGEITCKHTNMPVWNPEDAMQHIEDDMKIILMSYQYVSMWRQLQELGVDGNRILFGIMFPPFSEKEQVLFELDGRMAVENKDVIYFRNSTEKFVIKDHQQLLENASNYLREKYRREYPLINAIANMDARPASKIFGLERGGSIDRYYIEQFLEKNKELIHGDCLEIAENTYTLRYGGDRVENSYILHVKGWGENAIKGNLETGEGIEENRYDCAVITQTLMFIFDIRKVAENIYRMLKKGGSALITVAGISQVSQYDAERWGSYYGFHEGAMRALFEPLFGSENVIVQTYGNVKTAIAMLYGMCQEDLTADDFEMVDKDYPLVLSVIATKR